MPRIIPIQRTVSAQAGIPGRRATPADFGAGTGLFEAGQTITNVGMKLQDIQQRQEISDVQTRLAQTRANLTIELDQTLRSAVPGDMSVAGKFLEKSQNQIEALGDNVSTRGGRQAYEAGKATLLADIQRSVFLAQADLAGKKAKQDFIAIKEADRNTLLNDPTQFWSVLDGLVASLKDPAGQFALMPAAARLQLATEAKQELALSAVQGFIRMSPEYGKKLLTEGRFDKFLDADNKNALLREADLGIASRATESERARRAVARAEKATQAAQADELFTKFATGELTMTDVLNSNLPAFGENSKNHFRQMLDVANKPDTPAVISHRTTVNALAAINAPGDDPSKIRDIGQLEDMYKQGKLTVKDLNFLRTEYKNAHSPEGEQLSALQTGLFKVAARGIDPSQPLMGFVSFLGGERLYEYQRYVAEKIQEFRKDPNKDVFELFDPTSPDYLARQSLVMRYRPSLREQIQEVTSFLRSPGGQIIDKSKRKSLKSIFGIK